MTLHLIKLCVGVDTVAELVHWQRERVAKLKAARADTTLYHRTRQTPRRAHDLLDGGSIYWVIKGVVQVRQRLIGFRAATGDDGIARCDLLLDPMLVATRPQPRRPFQGWRYLYAEDAPADLAGSGDGAESMPAEMRATLGELGLL